MNKLKNLFKFLWSHKKISIALIFFISLIIYFLIPKNKKEIETIKVKKNNILQTISASGAIDSETTVNLSFNTGGKLTYLGAKKGDQVTKYQTIAVLDQRSIRENLQNALEDYAKQRNSYEETMEKNQNRTPEGALNSQMRRILENNQNDLDKAVNSVELQNLVLEQSVIVSPIDGIVTRSDVEVAGVNISPTTVFTIADPLNLVFNTDVDEADIGKVFPGQVINVTLDAFPNRVIPLTVSEIDFISHLSDSGATVYTVKAYLPAMGNYRIGMNGDAELIVERRNNILVIPLSSLIDEKHVYVKSLNKYEKKRITTGIQSDTEIEVVRGLKEGDEVALIPEDVEKQINK